MAVFIGSNTIASTKTRLAVDDSIRKAIGVREGTWRVSLLESADPREWKLIVRGPNGCHWTQKFHAKDCNPAHIGAAIQESLEKADEEMNLALSELVKEGVMFTREMLPDGTSEYVIDRTRLSGDEVKYLRNHGALTRRGIEQFIAARK